MDDVGLITADNPGPFTLRGTNTWLVGRNPCYVVDPGPLMERHLTRVLSDARDRGGIAGIAITHDHLDHVEAVDRAAPARGRRADGGRPLRGRRRAPGRRRSASARCGPSPRRGTPPTTSRSSPAAPASPATPCWARARSSSTPTRAPCAATSARCGACACSGCASSARATARSCSTPAAKLDEYLAHRLERERRLVEALDAGLRTADDLLDRVWSDAPAALRPAATVTLAAHLDKLAEEDRLPDGVERPQLSLLGEP